MQQCSGNCLDEHLATAAESMGATATESGVLLPGGAMLDMGNLPDKLFLVEIASLYSGVKAQIQASGANAPPVLEVTLVGLHGLESTYGATSDAVSGARKALLTLLQDMVSMLDAKFHGDVTYQASRFEVSSQATVANIMGWKSLARRRLAGGDAETWLPADQAAASKQFTSKAAAYGAFILLLYFSLAGVWCMCNMPFKQDSMLFGAKKYE